MNLYAGPTEQRWLKNVSAMMFSESPEKFFPYTQVDIVVFPEGKMKNPHKRLTSTFFMERYRRFLTDNGIIHLKTDSNFLFTYTSYMVDGNKLPLIIRTTDLYGEKENDVLALPRAIQTYYEAMWMSGEL